MKKLTLGVLVLLFVFLLVGCESTNHPESEFRYTESEVKGIVIQCKEHAFHPDETFSATANLYLSQGDYTLWNMYMNMANANGTYDYNVTIDINGETHFVIRQEEYKVGELITVTKVDTYQHSNLIKTEYK